MPLDPFGLIQSQKPWDMAYLDQSGQWRPVSYPIGVPSLLAAAETVPVQPPHWANKATVLVQGDIPLLLESNITPGTLTNVSMANRTRTEFFTAHSTPTVDSHGGVIGNVPHIDAANAVSETFYWRGIHLPVDYVPASSASLNIRFSSDAAGGSWAYTMYLVTQIAGTTGQAQVDNGGVATPCNATANRPNDYNFSVGSLTTNSTLYAFIITDRASLLDDNTGVVSIWDVWLSYVADM